MKSVSRTGQSDVVMEFAWGTDRDQAGLEERDKMEVLQLPLEAEAQELIRFNPSTEPILRLALSSTAQTATDPVEICKLTGLRRYPDDVLKKRIATVGSIVLVTVAGCPEDRAH